MMEQKFVYIDVNYLKELEETAKKVDYYKGIIDGINMVADRKTENCSEFPNNSTISKMEQVEDEFKQFDREDLILLIECQKERIAELLAKDEPQIEPNLILPERMERGEMYEVGDSIVVMNSEDYYDLLCKSWEKDEPQTEMTTEQIVNELLSIKQILDDGKMPKQTHDIRTNTHECVKDTHDKTEPQTYCDNCMYLHCNYECAGEIVHKMIDDAVIAEDVYPDLRQRMHDAVDEYEPQTERSE